MCISTGLHRQGTESTRNRNDFCVKSDTRSDGKEDCNNSSSKMINSDEFNKNEKHSHCKSSLKKTFNVGSESGKTKAETNKCPGGPHKEMKRSYSFAGFGLLSSRPSFIFSEKDSINEMTNDELEVMVHPTKNEVSKISKQQIKEYANKYNHLARDVDEYVVPWYTEALEHTQAAHLVTIIAIVYLAFRLFPDSTRSPMEASTLTRLMYVSSISTVFGSQIWMTFFSGLALFFNVPRHTFAQVQTILFPLYFLLITALMLIVIITYTQHHPTHLWEAHHLVQGIALVFCFAINLFIRLYLSPLLIKLITVKMAIEAETGLGSEVGTNQPGVLSKCPQYMRLYRTFRKVHMTIALGNMAALASTSFHLYYIATQLCQAET